MVAGEVELPALPRETVLFLVVWNAVGLVALVVLVGPWMLGLWVVAAIVNGALVGMARRRLRQPFSTRATPTGAVVLPRGPSGVAEASIRYWPAWEGRGFVPTALGGFNTSIQLSMTDAGVVVSVRPAILGLAFGFRATTYPPSDTVAVVPVARRGGKGIAIQPFDRPATYVFTAEAPFILRDLEHFGFPVDWREQRVRLSGRSR